MRLLELLKNKKIRTRIAPSPTGPLHIGTARTALFNYIFAKQNNGDFILRIEDTDKQRSDKRFEEDIFNGLTWLDLKHDELYRQSERTDIYRKYIKKLLDKKKAFWCYHSKEELGIEKKRQIDHKEPPRHVCNHKNKSYCPPENKKGIIRLKGSDKKIKFDDLIRGEIEYNASLLGDVAIAKNEDSPLYNFAVVIDDQEMEISHVIRGEDHIPNTPKQLLIQEALGFKKPVYAHVPLILGPDRSKLSKRHGATSINEYKRLGYLKEALVNFIVLIGWNPGKDEELIERDRLEKIFSLKNIQKGGAVFNVDKLNWFNREYIKNTPAEKLSAELMEYIPEEWQKEASRKKDFWNKITELEKPRLTTLSEIKEGIEFFFKKPIFPKHMLMWKSDTSKLEETLKHLEETTRAVSNIKDELFTKEEIKNSIWSYAEENGKGEVLWPFRVALTGRNKSPDPFDISEILGKEETLKRLKHAKDMIYGHSSTN
ncbi:MAG: glutamate--tRNA ligase [Patescibacteria group bacterium]